MLQLATVKTSPDLLFHSEIAVKLLWKPCRPVRPQMYTFNSSIGWTEQGGPHASALPRDRS